MKKALFIIIVVVLVLTSFFIAVWAILQKISADHLQYELEYNKVKMSEEINECSTIVNDLKLKVDSLNNLVIDMSDK